jgi:hypothetical protein
LKTSEWGSLNLSVLNLLKTERERGRKYSRKIDQVKNNGKSERHFIVGREKEHHFVRSTSDMFFLPPCT